MKSHFPCLLGASIVGVNCHFDPETCLKTVKLMKEGLQAAKLKAHLMSQPLAFHTPDCGKQGFIDLPEFPFGKTWTCLTLLVNFSLFSKDFFIFTMINVHHPLLKLKSWKVISFGINQKVIISNIVQVYFH